MTQAFVWILSYFLGSIPFGVVLAKSKKIDLRQHGSGNIGATNVTRTLGKTAGLLTLAGDCGKGYLACWIAESLLAIDWKIGLAGLLAFLGHIFSVFLKFKGGKGIATGLGIYLFLMPLAGLTALGLFILNLLINRYVSISSMLAAISVPITGYLLSSPLPYIYVSIIAAIITIYKHKENIQRLINGTERKFMKK